MNVFLHSLLIDKKMNNFTVTEAKDALLREHIEFVDDIEARKFIYRQLTRHIKKGLLNREEVCNNDKNKVIYSKTEKFFTSDIVAVKRTRKIINQATFNNTSQAFPTLNYKIQLEKELLTHRIDFNTTLEEAKEYKRLSSRFPNLQEKIQEYELETKNKSTKLLGKINALQNILGDRAIEDQTC
jgi:hypothetical protein